MLLKFITIIITQLSRMSQKWKQEFLNQDGTLDTCIYLPSFMRTNCSDRKDISRRVLPKDWEFQEDKIWAMFENETTVQKNMA